MFGCDIGKVCLFSAMSGVITLDGKPVAGALLKRTVDHQKPKSDETDWFSNINFRVSRSGFMPPVQDGFYRSFKSKLP